MISDILTSNRLWNPTGMRHRPSAVGRRPYPAMGRSFHPAMGRRACPAMGRRLYPATCFLFPVLLTVLVSAGCEEETLSHQELLDACARRNACEVMPYPSLAGCAEEFYQRQTSFGMAPVYRSLYHCVNNTGGDCAAVRACFGYSETLDSCTAEYQASCSGRRAHSCDLITHRSFSLDCSQANLQCAVPQSQSFAARCTPGTCQTGDPRTCQKGKLHSCNDGVIEVSDCDAQGLTCAANASGVLDCVGRGDACTSAGAPASCDGQVAVRCVGGRIHREDCSKNPLASACQDGTCTGQGTQCQDDFDRCQGEHLESCLDGQWQVLDCQALGLGPCRDGAAGALCSAP